ncbi:beta-ketoacyl synthase N-terminal-like domain-containing protein [Streptomyces sp. NBC_01537]|uniref:beta-ketoacyl synthase N-terminal-like domain-containing protein n=1 Tax=Streptomyces sp. NBC_01537 TaxID=2903896 RepID=UPI00386D738E
MRFEPIAVVGQGCVLPDAPDPATFWENIASGRVSLSRVPGERWRISHAAEAPRTDQGGYVRDFGRVFDPDGFLVGAGRITGLDPLFQWVLHSAREALRGSGAWQAAPLPRAGLVLGNLSFPSAAMARYAQQVWSAAPPGSRPDARNRFSSGLPAHFAARALGLGAGAFAVDAACASSLYAVKLACDRLHDGTADLMLAGGVNCADDLFVHIGFHALSAMSRTGRSRPFHQDADGLVPAEGAAFVALMRLRDAVSQGRPVLGVIRGVGLSNDGRDGGLLTPSEEGQVRAMRLAYESAGITADTVSLVECHATGTQLGDAVEIRSMNRVFGACESLPIGSVKSNLGHPVTAAGLAGLLKVLGAMRTGIRPATIGADEPSEALRGTPLRLLTANEPWDAPHRRAAVSAFGFGGNNAHVIVDAWEGAASASVPLPLPPPPKPPEPVAIVAIGARVGDGDGVRDLTRALLNGTPAPGPRSTVDVELAGLRFPPRDLERAHAQQLLLMEAAREAAHGIVLPRERTMVLVGMGCDPEVARYHARWRAADGQADAYAPPLDAAGVLGTMPNVVANRLNAQLDLAGPGCSVSAEEASGPVALGLAARALAAGEADAAVVGAVDLSHEPVHLAALAELGHGGRTAGDAAVALVLKRLADARRDGDPVIAVLDDSADPATADMLVGAAEDVGGRPAFDPAALFGTPHAATGLLAVACAALALHHRALPAAGAPAVPALGVRSAEVTVTPLDAPAARLRLRAAEDTVPAAWLAEPPPRLHIYSGRDLPEALAALAAGRESGTGPARLVIVAATDGELATRSAAARRWLTGQGIRPDGVAFRAKPLTGEVAFVYTNGSAAYPRMGRELMLAFPAVTAELEARCGPLEDTVGWAYRGSGPAGPPAPAHVLDQIWGAALLAQFHTEITRGVLGIQPQAVLGYSSGESAALVSMRAWRDVRSLVHDISGSDVFASGVVGTLDAVRRAWAKAGVPGDRWASHMVSAPVDAVRKALAGNPAVHLMAVNAPDVCVVGGEERECARVLSDLAPGQAIRLDYDIAVHAPEVEEVREEWRRLHHRPTEAVPGVRFYTGAGGDWYTPTRDSAADAITAQAVGTIDFDRMVERAWADGVRVFIEHGPRALCTSWIERTLGDDRDHVAVSLDSSEGHGIRRLTSSVAELVAAGVPLDADTLFAHLAAVAPAVGSGGPRLSFPAHPPAVALPAPGGQEPAAGSTPATWPSSGERAGTMAPAPWLPPAGSAARYVSPPRAAAPAGAAAQEMPPAPWLPPAEPAAVTATPATAAPVSRASGAGTAAASPVASAVSRALPVPSSAVTVDTPLTRVLAATAAHQHGLTTAFQDFLAQQAHIHHQFLAMRRRAEAALLRGTPPPAAPGSPAQPSRQPAQPPVGRPGPKFTRAQLEHLAVGRVSELFGPRFAAQDGRARQTRMPQPPMLLADRVTGIEAVPASMGTGTIWTETDVRPDSWYLDPAGRMPAGIMVEAGQADLLLISWLGADLLDGQEGQDDRVYRLLGCELTFHGPLPEPGETLRFEIRIDGHGEHDGTRLFFFRYDCYDVDGALRLTVRDGQAGFFTDAELARTGGVLWDPAADAPDPGAPLAPPVLALAAGRRAFGPDAVRAFSEGRPADCFGPAWRATRAHVRTPRIADGRLRLLDEVTDFDPSGGPWGRGFLRAETTVGPDDWFFAGHFKNDPCMPGTLMLEGCLQAMAFHLAALGHTADRDGWRFEPLAGAPYRMLCRGQVTPDSRLLTYEVFVREISGTGAGEEPVLVADVLCTVDGVRAFLARGLALRLARDWPLATLGGPAARGDSGDARPAAYGYPALLASAWGRPSEAFGALYGPAEDARRLPRLPGPPYHFISRIVSVDGQPGSMETGIAVVAEYDIVGDDWYFEQNGGAAMPLAVLMEIALQPCGWLASYAGCALGSDADLLFRNLDGSATLTGEVGPDTGTLRTRAELRQISQNGDMIIVSFEVVVEAAADCAGDAGHQVFRCSTVFGFFPPTAFAVQAGLTPSEPELTRLAEPCDRTADLPTAAVGPMLLMLDRVTGYWPDGGETGLGRLRGEKDIDPGEWFFRSHFLGDPVQPGSLGVEAMCQLLRTYLTETGASAGIRRPRFELIPTASPLSWKYRGQVVPANERVTVELEIRETGERYAVADAWLWVDGTRIYQVRGLGMRVVDDEPAAELVLDPAVDTWLADHRPTWTVPTLPMMSILDLLARAARNHTGHPVAALRDVQLRRWLPVREPVRLRTEVTRAASGAPDGEYEVTLLVWREAATAALSRFEPVATATVRVGEPGPLPEAFGPLPDASPADDPYDSGTLFHGPAFHYLVSSRAAAGGASGVLDAGRGSVPRGLLHQGLLDAALHVIPHDQLWRWNPEIGSDVAGFPHRIAEFTSYGPLPDSGEVRVEARFAGFDRGERRLPAFDVRLSREGRLLVAFRLVDVLVPKGRIATADPVERRAFLRDRRYANGVGLSLTRGAVTSLGAADAEAFDWLPGTVAQAYGLPPGARGRDHLASIAVRDHVARLARVHPSAVVVTAGLGRAWPADRPDEVHHLLVDRTGKDEVEVRSGPKPGS